jgi:hypothetical protein
MTSLVTSIQKRGRLRMLRCRGTGGLAPFWETDCLFTLLSFARYWCPAAGLTDPGRKPPFSSRLGIGFPSTLSNILRHTR